MKPISKLHTIVAISALIFAIVSIVPHMASANYTFQGRSFDTYAEMEDYRDEYMRVWNDIYGNSDDTEKVTTTKTASSKSKLEIDTRNVTDITKNGARLIGRIDFHQSKTARIWFDYGFSANNLIYRTETEVLKTKTGASPFDRKVLNLLPRTTYYYRAVGLNENGVYDYGEIKSFTTGVDSSLDTAVMRVRTGSATDIDNNRATLRGTIDFRKASYSYVWFEYSDEEGDLYKDTPKTLVYKENGRNYEYPIRKLDDETTYYYRIVGQDGAGNLSYGATVRIKTSRDIANEKPKVVTNTPQNIALYGATLIGTVDMNDYRNGVAFMVYGEDQNKVSTIARNYSRYKSIRADGDALQKILLDDDLDTDKTFTREVQYLDLNTKHYYALGVEYEDVNGNDVILMGRTQSFTTKKQ